MFQVSCKKLKPIYDCVIPIQNIHITFSLNLYCAFLHPCAACVREPGSHMWVYVFLGNALRGIGETPVTPLGISYIDDFAKAENSPFYIGEIPDFASMIVYDIAQPEGDQMKVNAPFFSLLFIFLPHLQLAYRPSPSWALCLVSCWGLTVPDCMLTLDTLTWVGSLVLEENSLFLQTREQMLCWTFSHC